MSAVILSQQQAKGFASAIYCDILEYTEKHKQEFEDFLLKYGIDESDSLNIGK